jgi:hypothetical protein
MLMRVYGAPDRVLGFPSIDGGNGVDNVALTDSFAGHQFCQAATPNVQRADRLRGGECLGDL